jgi:hypothetical protein
LRTLEGSGGIGGPTTTSTEIKSRPASGL